MSRSFAGAAAFALAVASLAASPAPAPEPVPAAAAECPPGYQATDGTGLDGGLGCRALFRPEDPREVLAAADASAGPRRTLHSSDRLEAIHQARTMMRDALERRARTGSRDFVTRAGFVVADSGAAWQLAGPLPLHADDTTYGPSHLGWTTLAGRVTALVVDPADATGDTVYLGAAAGGVWKTTNGGTTWVPIGDELPTLAIGALAVNDEDGVLYVGTGEANTNSDAYAGAGAWMSPDGGRTWRELGRPGARVPADLVTSEISTAGSFVYVATSQGLYRSADRGATVTKVDLPTGEDGELGTFVTDVDIRPGVDDHSEVLAAVGWRSGKVEGAGLYRSTDSGLTWAKVDSPTFGAASPNPDNIGRITIAYPTGPEQDNRIVWAVIQDPGKLNNENNPIAYTTPASVPPTTLNGVYRSGDNGTTWELKGSYEIFQNPATNPGSALIGALTPVYGPGIQAWYNQYVAVDPTNVDRVIVGLEEIYYTVANANVPGIPAEWRTAGRYWNSCTGLNVGMDTCPPAPIVYGGTTTHPDQHAIAFAPLEGGGVRVYAGNDGGVYSQEPDPVTGLTPSAWKSLNDTLPLAQPYGAAMGPDGTIWAGLQDNGTIKIQPNGRADMTFGGDGFDVAVAPDDSDLAFSETPNGAIRRTTNGGESWSGVTPSGASRQRFFTPFELDPLDGEHLVYGGGQVFETTSASTVTAGGWTNVFDLAEGAVPNAAATALDVRGSAVYAGWCGTAATAPAGTAACNITTTEGGDYDPSLFARGLATNVQDGCARETASSECWHQAAAKGLPNRYIHGIAIDPRDPKTVYVAMATYSRRWVVDRRAFGGGSIYKSTDAGETFVNISGNLPRAVAADILVAGDRLVVATDAGVFATDQKAANGAGTAWVPMGTGLPPVPAYDLSLNPQGTTLVAATHGRGIWTLPLTVPAGPNPNPGPGQGGGANPPSGGNNGVIPTTGLPAPALAPLALVPLLVFRRVRRRRLAG